MVDVVVRVAEGARRPPVGGGPSVAGRQAGCVVARVVSKTLVAVVSACGMVVRATLKGSEREDGEGRKEGAKQHPPCHSVLPR